MKKLIVAACLCAVSILAYAENVDLVNSPQPQQFKNGAYFGPGQPNKQATTTSPMYVFGDAGFGNNVTVLGSLQADGGVIIGNSTSQISFFSLQSTYVPSAMILPGSCVMQAMPLPNPGSNAGDVCLIGLPALTANNIRYDCYVKTGGFCQISECNDSMKGLASMAGVFKCVVIH